MTARRIRPHFFGPNQAKNSSRLAAERSRPPNQIPDGRLATPPADGEGETLGVEGIVGEPFQAFGLHAVAAPAEDSAKAVSEVDPLVATGEVADAAGPLVVEGPVGLTTDIANRFFRRRLRVMTTAWGSPKRPRMRAWGTNPGNRYRSWRSLNLAIARA